MKKLAVLFPGVGYTCDKPLLYYAAKVAKDKGYEVQTVPYKDFESDIKGDANKMKKTFVMALCQAEEILKDIHWSEYGDIVFISKSVGTVVSSAFAQTHGLVVRNFLLTPVKETFMYSHMNDIAIHGSADPWANTGELMEAVEGLHVPFYIVKKANHSLETGNIQKDLIIVEKVMKKLEEFLDDEE